MDCDSELLLAANNDLLSCGEVTTEGLRVTRSVQHRRGRGLVDGIHMMNAVEKELTVIDPCRLRLYQQANTITVDKCAAISPWRCCEKN
jgi:hypothetical protein